MGDLTKCSCPEEHVWGIQYSYDDPEHYDGVSEWHCAACGKRVGRWSGRVLGEGEAEKASERFQTTIGGK